MGKARRAKALAVNTLRANSGLINEIVDKTIDRWIEGEDFQVCLDAAKDDIATSALNSHGDKVRAALSRAGLNLAVETALTPQAIADAVNEKTGLGIKDFSPKGVLDAIDGMLAKRITRETGIHITSVFGASLTDQLKAGVRLALRSGQAKKLVGILLDQKARRLATLKRLNSDASEFKKVRNRKYQAKWRETHTLAWE